MDSPARNDHDYLTDLFRWQHRSYQARHLILERLRGQAEENDAVVSALEAAMRQCASAQQGAAACLGLNTGSGVEQAKADGVAPMDVVDEGTAVVGGQGGGGVGTGNVNESVGVVVEKGIGAAGKGKLRAVPADENVNGR